MRSFKEFVDDDAVELDEGALRNLGSAALFGRILSLSRKIKRSKDIGTKIDLLASQNSTVAAIVMAVGKFLEKSKR